ncbi:unnamed protein product [Allacma fusca]|uniref:Mitochondrial ornithine transporter 1 n=1 Tax=Allacma fusca TaxID=39272 RepID=A0A8J2PNZ3_9HEXA|nr:unnamed protein product [Allacma fusca]
MLNVTADKDLENLGIQQLTLLQLIKVNVIEVEDKDKGLNMEGSSKAVGGKDVFIDLLSGTAGGIASVYVGQPGDTIKVKMQTFPRIYSKGMVNCFMETLRNDGIRRGLYAGTAPALIANVAENSILFAAYGVCQKAVAIGCSQPLDNMNPLHNAIAGFLAGFFSSFTLCPAELIKCRLQAVRETLLTEACINIAESAEVKLKSIGPWTLTRKVFVEEGFFGFYRGLTSTIAREMPGYFFFFGGYEICRHFLTPPGKRKEEIGSIRTMVCGGMGGVAFWTAIFPTDVVKSRIQVSNVKQTVIRCMTEIIRKEGVRALYNGLGPTLFRTFPATGALFLAYEHTEKILNTL